VRLGKGVGYWMWDGSGVRAKSGVWGAVSYLGKKLVFLCSSFHSCSIFPSELF